MAGLRNIPITQEILDSLPDGEYVEQVTADDSIEGLCFLQVSGGMWTIYSFNVKQSLRRRWNSLDHARVFATTRLCDRV